MKHPSTALFQTATSRIQSKKKPLPVIDSQQQGILISASAVPFSGEVEETTKTRQAVALYSLFQNVSVLDFPGERIPRNRDDNDIHKLQMNNANDEGNSRTAYEEEVRVLVLEFQSPVNRIGLP